ncbi:hypothetical protein [Pseudomonas saponiphila]|uniref:hypothetical protein n=1 Tax=Pseudomonas saponiphila TaxID=556534 RepID=UPI002240545F|nr:hypothetical protein [Pseudomonas saponiphila]
MNNISNWTLTALCAAILTGCGSSTDKAEELVKTMDVDAQYKAILMMTTTTYSSKYPGLPADQIQKTIEKNVTKELIHDTLVEVYADHFDSSELELIIEATKNPQNAMAIVMGSKGGQALALKSVKVQSELQHDIVKALEGADEDIVDDLDDLRKKARG